MSRKKKLSSAILILLLLIIGSVLVIPDHTSCNAPLLITGNAKADMIITDLVNRLGGLPSQEVDSTSRSIQAIVLPVKNWEIESVDVGNSVSLLGSLTDDDPVYSYTIDFKAFYDDGSEQRLRWSSWRYGLVVCPFLLLSGDGPPGELRFLNSPST